MLFKLAKALNKQFNEKDDEQEKSFKQKNNNQITPKEHEERLKALRESGIKL